MGRNRNLTEIRTKMFTFFVSLLILVAIAAVPVLSKHSSIFHFVEGDARKFEIADDMFWKDKEPFRIVGGDLHYFRVHPEYWEDRLMRAKALGLNTIQTYVPWNLHEPRQGHLEFEGFADIILFLEVCSKLDLLVMLRAGPYICGEWDLGGIPAWLLSNEPPIKLRSSDPAFLDLVEKWWGVLLPKIYSHLYSEGGPIIMVQIENEFGSYGSDKAYLHYLVALARRHLGNDIILYTTDGGARETLQNGTIPGEAVFSAVDFTTGDEPWPIFQLQKEFNAPGKSPPLSTEFYTGWLTHWGESIATTDANFTAASLEKILSKNGSVVLYMAHGGTNFGFYSGANTGANGSDYKPDLSSYDYDAPIRESGDVDNEKYRALREVIAKYTTEPLVSVPPDNEKLSYGRIKLENIAYLFDMITQKDRVDSVFSDDPVFMEAFGQMSGFALYASNYTSNTKGSTLLIPKVHDRAQVFISCSADSETRPLYIGIITRWSNHPIALPYLKCESQSKLLILVENMGHLNYGPYIFDRKGILSSVYLDEEALYEWEMLPVSFQNLNEAPTITNPIILNDGRNLNSEPAFYSGNFFVEKARDSYISFRGWSKGIAFLNNINIGRFWPSAGPQCNLYIPAPFLREGDNTLVILELESPKPDFSVSSVDHQDFTCGLTNSKMRRHRFMSSW